jgi:hypothetical protein
MASHRGLKEGLEGRGGGFPRQDTCTDMTPRTVGGSHRWQRRVQGGQRGSRGVLGGQNWHGCDKYMYCG